MTAATKTEQVICRTSTVYGQSKNIGIYALAHAANDLAAAGAACLGAGIHIMIPSDAYKSRINTMKKIIEACLKDKGIELLELKAERTPAAAQSMVTATLFGQAEAGEPWCTNKGHAGQSIVLTKWAGMEGMLRILTERREELKERFAPAFLNQIQGFEQDIFALREIDIAKSMSVSKVYQIGAGGVLAALWNLAKESGAGLKLDMKKISVLQETIEVCEHFRMNPYQLTSAGSMLMICDDGEALAETFRREQIHASVIGVLTDNNDKIIQNGEEIRYIDRPAPDALLGTEFF